MRELHIFVRQFKKSLFFRFLVLIFALMAGTLLIFSYFSYRIISHEYIKQSKLINQSLLQQIADKVENTIDFIEGYIASVAGNRYVVNVAVKPGAEYVERNASLLSFLKEAADSSEYVSAIYVYEKASNALFSSKGAMCNVDSALNAETIRTCVSDTPRSILFSTEFRYDTYLSYVDERIYLVHASIPIENTFHLFVIAELNKEALFRNAYEICWQTANCLDIIDRNNAVVLNIHPRPETLKLNNAISFEAKYPSWIFRFYLSQASLPSAKDYLKAVLPFSIVVLAISIILVPYIAWRVYSPIWELAQNVSADEKPTGRIPCDVEYTNEIDYLLRTYDAAIQDRDAILTLVREVRPELEERLLISLINGADYSEAELDEKLHNMCSAWSVDDKYQVILAYPKPDDRKDNDVDRQIILYQLKGLLQHIRLTIQATMFFLPGVRGYGIVILRYPGSTANEIIRSCGDRVIEEMKKFSLQRNIDVLFSKGRIFNSLRDVRLSFDSAEEQIRYQIYFAAEHGETAAMNHDRTGFSEQIELLIDHVKRYEWNSAEQLLGSILDHITHSDMELSIKKRQYAHILDALAERALMGPIDDCTLKRQWLGEVYTDLRNTDIQTNLVQNVHAAAQELLRLVQEASIKTQSRHVMRAKEYIENNYSNINLSVSVIAEEIGISASYLSKIFVEYTGDNLVRYLNAYRVDMAKDLLANTNIMIRDVGYKTGFNTIQNFNRVFKRYTGETPSEFRARYHND